MTTYQIENDSMIATFTEKGAECCRLYNKDTKIDYLWDADENYWGRHAPILFPIIGKLKDNTYQYQHHTYTLNGHGFARDKVFRLFRQDEDMISFVLEDDDDTYAHYPFHFRLKVTYKLEKTKMHVYYQVDNIDNKPLYFSVGGHPAFNVPLQHGEWRDYRLTIKPNAQQLRYYVSGTLIDGQHSIKETLPFDWRLDHRAFERDAMIYETPGDTSVILSNIHDDHGVTVHYNDIPYVGIWSPYPTEAPFICIEPWWGMADTLDADGDITHKKGIITLSPDDYWSGTYSIECY